MTLDKALYPTKVHSTGGWKNIVTRLALIGFALAAVSGAFESNGSGVRLSKAAVFEPGRVPVIGRFSLDGGQPYQPDRPDTRRGLGLQFSTRNGELWRTAMINFPLFPVRTPEIFFERLLAFKPDPATGKPDPANVKAFEERHPETVEVLKVITAEPQASGFGNTTFYGLNTFRFTNPAGMAPSDDPVLSARSAVYARSFARRVGETKQPSAITPADVKKEE